MEVKYKITLSLGDRTEEISVDPDVRSYQNDTGQDGLWYAFKVLVEKFDGKS